jgi:hypothetical protein
MTEMYFRRYETVDKRLGRNVKHDSRSLDFQVEAAPTATLKTVNHKVNIGVLNQGNLGSCTGNAGTANLAANDLWANYGKNLTLDEKYAVALYGRATALDDYQGTYPPTDTGSDGLTIAKVLKERNIIDSYQHATSLAATLTALQSQAVITGTEWREDMFNPDDDGRLRITGDVAGGHEYLLRGVDVENKRVWMRNSWGKTWGVAGEAYFTWDDFEELLHADGDVTVMHAAPVPTPEPDADAELTTALSKYLSRNKAPLYLINAARKWLDR